MYTSLLVMNIDHVLAAIYNFIACKKNSFKTTIVGRSFFLHKNN